MTPSFPTRRSSDLCKHCKEPYDASTTEKEQLGLDPSQPLFLQKPVGCPLCRHTGYLGRSGVHEVIEVDRKLEEMIHDNASEQQLEAYARSQGDRKSTRLNSSH